MRIIIYGTGAVGGVIGALLSLTDQAVLLVGRNGNVDAINKNGLKLITPSETHILRITAVNSIEQARIVPSDVIFLCMKAQDVEPAILALKSVIEDVPVFCFQNGVSIEEMATKYFTRVYGVMVRIGAGYLRDGEVTVRFHPPGSMVMGKYPFGIDNLLEDVSIRLRTAGFLVRSSYDVMPYKWGKLVFNLENAIGAITNAKRSEVAMITEAAREELQQLLLLGEIRWISQKELEEEWPETRIPPDVIGERVIENSTWQSLIRRTGNIEADFINGEVVRLAKIISRQAPINDKIVEICLRMAKNKELPGKYSPEQLARLLGIG